MDSPISFNETGTIPEKRPHKHGKYVLLLFLVLIAGIVCWYIHRPSEPPPKPMLPKPGTVCTVQFRYDALGEADTGADVMDGKEIALTGFWIIENSEAILLKGFDIHNTPGYIPENKNVWIPKSSILLIEYESPKTEQSHADTAE